ncbi:MAG: hypothetical protein R3E10_13020 [Gemmatimonadota bacterium]
MIRLRFAAGLGVPLLLGCASSGGGPPTAPAPAETPEQLLAQARGHFEAGEWSLAIDGVDRAVGAGLDPARTRDLRAGALLLSGAPAAALRTWGHDTPRIDVIRVRGTRSLDERAVLARAGLVVGARLDASTYVRAQRRLTGIPAASATAVRFHPRADRTAEVELVLAERPRPLGSLGAAVTKLGEALVREQSTMHWPAPVPRVGAVRLDGRWSDGRRSAALGLDDVGIGLPGRTDLSIGIGTESYADDVDQWSFTRIALRTGDWVSERTFLAGTVGWEQSTMPSVSGRPWLGVESELRALDDRARVSVQASRRASTDAPAQTVAVAMGVRTKREFVPLEWQAALEGGVEHASASTPRPLWPGAGVGRARAPLLRAHPLLEGGAIRVDRAFGRLLVHASGELQSPSTWAGWGWMSGALFIDAGRAAERAGSLGPWTAVDAGTGFRFHTPFGWALRVDGSVGLLDGEKALSVGLLSRWNVWRSGLSRVVFH